MVHHEPFNLLSGLPDILAGHHGCDVRGVRQVRGGVVTPTYRPDYWQDEPESNEDVILELAMRLIPILAALGVLFVFVLDWLGEL